MHLATILLNANAPLITDHTWIFFLVLVIILFAPILLSRLHIPHVVGLILAGILVGEYGFNLLERDSSFELFGQVGIYYIMFLAGLELDMGSVKKYGRQGVFFGLLTFGIPFVLGFFSSRHLLHLDTFPALLVSCIYASHTLVSYPIVGRYGMGRHRSVVISVVATAFATFAALLILALVVGMQNPDTGAMAWVLFSLKCIVYMALVALVFPRLGRWFLRRYDDSVMQYIFVIALVFLSAALANLAGLEGLLGAFLAGLAINRLIPRTSPLMNRIEFVGQAIFIPYFLIGVGMMIDIRVLGSGLSTLWLVGVMVVVATISKLAAAGIMHLFSGKNPAQLWLMFGLTNAHAAGALAIVMVGSSPEVGLIDPILLNGAIMVILFSCIISSLATNHGARKLALTDTTLDDNRGSYHGKCLVAYSQEDNVDVMTQLAILIRNPYIPDSLMGLSVAFDDDNGEDQYRKGKALLEKAQKTAAAADISMATLSRMSTNVASGILHTIKEYEVGEVIMCLTDRETGMAKSSLGNVINNVLAGSHRELMIVRSIVPPGTLKQIVVAVPEKAEYEVGFYKWLEHLGRIGEQIDCRMTFHCHPATMNYIKGFMAQKHTNVRASFVEMTKWSSIRQMAVGMNEDHMLVVVTARPGFISHTRAMDRFPQILSQRFKQTNIMLLYPDQWGDPMEELTIFAPNGKAVTVHPKSFSGWISLGWRKLLARKYTLTKKSRKGQKKSSNKASA